MANPILPNTCLQAIMSTTRGNSEVMHADKTDRVHVLTTYVRHILIITFLVASQMAPKVLQHYTYYHMGNFLVWQMTSKSKVTGDNCKLTQKKKMAMQGNTFMLHFPGNYLEKSTFHIQSKAAQKYCCLHFSWYPNSNQHINLATMGVIFQELIWGKKPTLAQIGV